MSEQVIFKLKDIVTNPDGTPGKDGSKETRSQIELAQLSQAEATKNWPDLTIGSTLISLINGKKNLENMEEVSRLYRLSSKINNKMLTEKGEWKIEKQELLDLKEIFDKSDPKTLTVSMHGQVYNKIQDLLVQVSAS